MWYDDDDEEEEQENYIYEKIKKNYFYIFAYFVH